MRFVCYVNLGKVRNSGDMVVLLVNTSVYNIINCLEGNCFEEASRQSKVIYKASCWDCKNF